MKFKSVIVSCEHASNAVPARWRAAFLGHEHVLNTHRAWDPGAALVARELAHALGVPAFFGEVTRLLIDLNRSADHPGLYSDFTPQSERAGLLKRYWRPYRGAVRTAVARAMKRGPTLHLSIHSFTPALDGKLRTTEFGLLYDPARPAEMQFVLRWQRALRRMLPNMRTKLNNPYRGTSDGCTTALRAEFGRRYCGIELEMNHAFSAKPPDSWTDVRAAIVASVVRVLA